MRVLLIEDEPTTAKAIELMLTTEGFNVYTTDLGEEGLDLGKLYDYDIILLDLNLPDMHGYDVLKKLRVAKVQTPVLILSGISEMDSKVRSFGFGADDYVTKPFQPKELAARIRALMRRVRGMEPPSSVIRLSQDLEVRPDEGVVRLRGEDVHLTMTEFRLLCEMASGLGRVFSREMLLERVWGYGYFGDGKLVDVHIYRLRAKIEDDPANPRYVLTVRGLGYKVVA